ncbi:MAG: hypothetical protein ABI969_17770 [bacterium]
MTTTQRRVAAFLAGSVAVAVAAILLTGLWLARPAQVSIGKPPADLAAEYVSIAGGSGAIIKGWLSPRLSAEIRERAANSIEDPMASRPGRLSARPS